MSHLGNIFSTFRSGVTAVSVKKSGWPVKKSSPLPLWEFRLPVKTLALSARRLDNDQLMRKRYYWLNFTKLLVLKLYFVQIKNESCENFSKVMICSLEKFLPSPLRTGNSLGLIWLKMRRGHFKHWQLATCFRLDFYVVQELLSKFDTLAK